MRDILAIVGSHPGTRGEFDFTREDCDIWVFNEAMSAKWALRADAVFQMHVPTIWRNPANRNDKNHYEWLKSGNTPAIYMQDVYEDVPRSTKYPIDGIRERFGFDYFTSSVSYAIALGAFLNYSKIEIYGVEMETDTEYRFQRDGVTFWIGVCAGSGVTVEVHSKLLKSPLYGYQGDVKIPYEVFTGRIAELVILCDKAQKFYVSSVGKVNDAVEKFVETGANPEMVIASVQQQIGLVSQFGLVDGARQENERYKAKADVMIKATGDFVFSRQEFEQWMQATMKQREVEKAKATALAEQCEAMFKEIIPIRNGNKRKLRMNKLIDVIYQYVQSAAKVGMYDGAAIENKTYLEKLDTLIRMAGGEKSAEVLLEAMKLEAVPA